MDDAAFAAYVLNNAPRYEIETLETVIRGLNDNIASRRWGKPAGLKIGDKIAATLFDASFAIYGEVISMTPQACSVEVPGSKYKTRVSYKRHAIRVLDEFEWNRISMRLEERSREVDAELTEERAQKLQDRLDAINAREKAASKPIALETLNGTVSVFRGAYVHAYRPDQGVHDYGVVIEITAKRMILSNAESDWEPRIWASKSEIELLTEEQWLTVDAEQRRRRTEYEEASAAGITDRLPDYAVIQIPLDVARV